MSAGARRRSTVFSKFPRVSPAMGVALVALAFAVSGTSFAQGAATSVGRLISGSRITLGSITGSRIKTNSLTGKQIDEKSLATVPFERWAYHRLVRQQAQMDASAPPRSVV